MCAYWQLRHEALSTETWATISSRLYCSRRAACFAGNSWLRTALVDFDAVIQLEPQKGRHGNLMFQTLYIR